MAYLSLLPFPETENRKVWQTFKALPNLMHNLHHVVSHRMIDKQMYAHKRVSLVLIILIAALKH